MKLNSFNLSEQVNKKEKEYAEVLDLVKVKLEVED